MLSKIKDIHEKYGYDTFRDGMLLLISNGVQTYRKMDVEKEIRISSILSMPSGKEDDEKAYAAHRCAAELAQCSVKNIVIYLQNHIVCKDIRRFTTVRKPNPRIPRQHLYYTIITPAGVPATIPEGHQRCGRPFDGVYEEDFWRTRVGTEYQGEF